MLPADSVAGTDTVRTSNGAAGETPLEPERGVLGRSGASLAALRFQNVQGAPVVQVRAARAVVSSGERRCECDRPYVAQLHPDKTRLIEFGRHAAEQRKRRGEGKPDTFDFLGFTHMSGTTRKTGRFIVKRQTIRKRLTAKLHALKAELRHRWHTPVPQLGQWLRSVVQGWFSRASRRPPGPIWRASIASARRKAQQRLASPARPGRAHHEDEDGRTHLAHKAEHAVDMETGAIVGGSAIRAVWLCCASAASDSNARTRISTRPVACARTCADTTTS
jgi:hypothetical protein